MTRRRQRGFTFIEILIVMGIIGVLVGAIVVVTGIWSRKRPEMLTKDRMNKLELALRDWKRTFENYPPTDPARIPDYAQVGDKVVKMPHNKTNNGIESVVIALHWKGFKFEVGIQDEDYGNTDEDELAAPVGRLTMPALREVLDGWGNPFVYIHNRDYAKVDGDPASYTCGFDKEGAIDVEARPWKNEDGTFAEPMSFQLFSMGEDGEPNTDDDIRHWAK